MGGNVGPGRSRQVGEADKAAAEQRARERRERRRRRAVSLLIVLALGVGERRGVQVLAFS